MSLVKTTVSAIIAMVAFALNSLFARAALIGSEIDPASYTSIRLLSGALMLVILFSITTKQISIPKNCGSWLSAMSLFVYASFFSFAYLSLDTGFGAMLLFATVQATMIGWGIYQGERPRLITWLGNIVALIGFFILVSPGSVAGSNRGGMVLMIISGIAWGIYSLRGKKANDPLGVTTANFIYCIPLAALLALIFFTKLEVAPKGLLLACVSGAITSGLGYAIWYTALRGLTATNGAIIQLTAPVIAALTGVMFLGETLSAPILLGGGLILAGVATAILAKRTPINN